MMTWESSSSRNTSVQQMIAMALIVKLQYHWKWFSLFERHPTEETSQRWRWHSLGLPGGFYDVSERVCHWSALWTVLKTLTFVKTFLTHVLVSIHTRLYVLLLWQIKNRVTMLRIRDARYHPLLLLGSPSNKEKSNINYNSHCLLATTPFTTLDCFLCNVSASLLLPHLSYIQLFLAL